MAFDIQRYLQWRFVIPVVAIFFLFNFLQTTQYFGSMIKSFAAIRLNESQRNSNSTTTNSSSNSTMASRLKLNSTTHAYELNGKPIIWQYWDKDAPPMYTRLFMEAMQCRNPEFEVIQVHESNIFEFLPDSPVPKNVFRLLSPGHQADVFRLHILIKYGGIYVDIDAFALDKLYPLYEMLRNVDLITGDRGYSADGFLNLAGIGPSRVNASHIRIWADGQTATIMNYFRNDSVIITTTTDPFDWIGILYAAGKRVEKAMKDEVANGRTKIYRYQVRPTVEQVITRIGPHSAHYSWSKMSSKLLPLNWAPFLFLWGYEIRHMFRSITNMTVLFPKEETIYSVFVGCALLDCQHEYERMEKRNVSKTRSDLDVSDLLRVLAKVNQAICRDVRNDSRVNELEKFMLKD